MFILPEKPRIKKENERACCYPLEFSFADNYHFKALGTPRGRF